MKKEKTLNETIMEIQGEYPNCPNCDNKEVGFYAEGWRLYDTENSQYGSVINFCPFCGTDLREVKPK